MKLIIEIDTDGQSNKGRVLVKKDGYLIGGIQSVSFTASLEKNEFVFYADGHRKVPKEERKEGQPTVELDKHGEIRRRVFPLCGPILGAPDSAFERMVKLFEDDIRPNMAVDK